LLEKFKFAPNQPRYQKSIETNLLGHNMGHNGKSKGMRNPYGKFLVNPFSTQMHRNSKLNQTIDPVLWTGISPKIKVC